MIEVIKSGLFSTIQDLGRFGQRKYGVPCSGAMDLLSMRKANAVLGNDEESAVLEMTLVGPSLRFLNQTEICISGANMNPEINDSWIEQDQVISVNANDVLTFGRLESGTRAYLAVRNGFQTEQVLGSRSMYKGITNSSRIADGDTLPIEDKAKVSQKKVSGSKGNAKHLTTSELAVYRGPEFELLSPSEQKMLLGGDFTISNNHSRMGYQLSEPMVNQFEPIISSPVIPGTVQLTPMGTIIILMRDAQTTGGYPRIFQLSENAINTVAQKKTNDKISFKLKDYDNN